MEAYNDDGKRWSRYFLYVGILLLFIGLVAGFTGSLQYIMPGFLKANLSFERIRPIHVSSVVFWIIMCSIGTLFTYWQQFYQRALYSIRFMKVQWFFMIISIMLILVSYIDGSFGGREYWEFQPILAIPIIIGWVLMFVNFFKSITSLKSQPVYVWMWLTGICFFLFTFIESYLWVIPFFRSSLMKDMTIQWKSYGSMVGSWNMLLYGSSLFLMEKISGSPLYSKSKMAFLLYFLGLTNLMFNWGHHIYTLPTLNVIKHISYIISMTELLILGRIIYQWKSTLSEAKKQFHNYAFKFLIAADVWVFLNLMLAIGMSVPALNVYTHGTHITVAHTMGATIGINSFLIIAFLFDILCEGNTMSLLNHKIFNLGYWLLQISLLVFWLTLITMGVEKSVWLMSKQQSPFSLMMNSLHPLFNMFSSSGFFVMIGFVLVLIALLNTHRRVAR